ncbi:hypothetical protein TB1_033630 [Malus domestica]
MRSNKASLRVLNHSLKERTTSLTGVKRAEVEKGAGGGEALGLKLKELLVLVAAAAAVVVRRKLASRMAAEEQQREQLVFALDLARFLSEISIITTVFLI